MTSTTSQEGPVPSQPESPPRAPLPSQPRPRGKEVNGSNEVEDAPDANLLLERSKQYL